MRSFTNRPGKPMAAFAALVVVLLAGGIVAPRAGSQAPAPGLTAICLEQSTNDFWMRARNPTDAPLAYTWRDQRTTQRGSGSAPARSDTFIALLNGAAAHTMIVTFSNGTVATKASNINPCQGKVTMTKTVAGDGTPPAGAAWPFELTGATGLVRRFSLAAGASRVEDGLPGGIEAGSVPQGTTPPGGYPYTIRELDNLGAEVTATVDAFSVGASSDVRTTFTNTYTASPPEPPLPPPTPTPPPPTPTPSPPSPSPSDADLAIGVDVSPERGRVDDAFTFRVRIVNAGPATARNAVATDIPTLPSPNRTAQLTFVRSSQGGCSSLRPVRCSLGDIPPGGSVEILAGARVRVEGLLGVTVRVASDTREPNLTDNQDVDGLLVGAGRASVRLRKTASRASVPAGGSVLYRLRVEGRGPATAVDLRVCDRLPAGTSIVSRSPRASVRGGQVCWAVDRLGEGARRTLSLRLRMDRDARRLVRNVASVTGRNVAARRAGRTVRVSPAGATGRPGGVTG